MTFLSLACGLCYKFFIQCCTFRRAFCSETHTGTLDTSDGQRISATCRLCSVLTAGSCAAIAKVARRCCSPDWTPVWSANVSWHSFREKHRFWRKFSSQTFELRTAVHGEQQRSNWFLQSFTHSFIHSVSQSIIQSFTYPLLPSFIRSFTESLSHWFIASSVHHFTISFIQLVFLAGSSRALNLKEAI